MNHRFLLAVATITVAILTAGCEPPVEPKITIELPEIGPFEPPVPEKTIVITVIETDDHHLGFAVYHGKEVDTTSRIEADSKDEFKSLIAAYIKERAASDPNLDTVLIECEGGVKTGDVEAVRAGIGLAEVTSSWRVLVGVRESTKDTRDEQPM